VQRQVSDAEDPDETGDGARRLLDVCFDEQVRPSLDRSDVECVALRFGPVAGDERAREFVQPVERDHGRRLGTEGMPSREATPHCRQFFIARSTSSSHARWAAWPP
jgi:hypothetical protein